jgi:restriction endonuclease S subunit
LVLSRKRAESKDGETVKYKLLTLKSFDTRGILNPKLLDEFVSNCQLENKYLTKENDIIIRLTSPYTALVIEANAKGIVIPSNFAIIRLTNDLFHPKYIALCLNSESTNKIFNKSAISTTIPLIKTSFLKNVNIVEKPLNIQKKIVELKGLQNREDILLNNLKQEKEKLAQAYIGKIIMEE